MQESRAISPLIKPLGEKPAEGGLVPKGKLLDRLTDQKSRPIHERKTQLFPKGRVEQFLQKHEGGVPGLLAAAAFLRENDDITWDDYAKLKAEIRAEQTTKKPDSSPVKAFDGTTAQ